MSMFVLFINLVLDWLDAVGSAIAILALFHPALRPRRGLLSALLPRWAEVLFNRRSDLDRFIEAARGTHGLAKVPATVRRDARSLGSGRR